MRTACRYLIVRFDEVTGDARYALMRGMFEVRGVIELQAWSARLGDAFTHHEGHAVVQDDGPSRLEA